MIVLLTCPWCSADMAVADQELQGELRCDECSTAFGFAPDAVSAEEARLVEAA